MRERTYLQTSDTTSNLLRLAECTCTMHPIRTAACVSSSTLDFLFFMVAISRAVMPFFTPRSASQHISSHIA